MLMRHRVQRMVHSVLTSRVLLHIREQAGENPVWSDGLTELSTIRFHDSDDWSADSWFLNRRSQNNSIGISPAYAFSHKLVLVFKSEVLYHCHRYR
jgi:hypothetical protein